MVQYFTNNQFFCSTIIFVLLSMLGPCCRLSCLILYIHIYILLNNPERWEHVSRMTQDDICLMVPGLQLLFYVFCLWILTLPIQNLECWWLWWWWWWWWWWCGGNVAMWQCGTQNEGPRKKSLQLSTAEHWEPVGFQEKTCRSKLRNWGMRTTRTMRSPCECLERPQADPVVWRL